MSQDAFDLESKTDLQVVDPRTRRTAANSGGHEH